MDYAQQIKSPKWQRLRLEVMDANGFQCQVCGEDNKELNVHHPYYLRGALIWEYPAKDLQCLCYDCHAEFHGLHKAEVRDKPYTGPTGEQQYTQYDSHDDMTYAESIARADVFFAFMDRIGANDEEVDDMCGVEYGEN